MGNCPACRPQNVLNFSKIYRNPARLHASRSPQQTFFVGLFVKLLNLVPVRQSQDGKFQKHKANGPLSFSHICQIMNQPSTLSLQDTHCNCVMVNHTGLWGTQLDYILHATTKNHSGNNNMTCHDNKEKDDMYYYMYIKITSL